LLAKKLTNTIIKNILLYNINDLDVDLYILGRPWLSSDDFKINIPEITDVLEQQVGKEISSLKNYSEKYYKLKDYDYKNISIDNYGEPVLDKNNNLIGYKISNVEYASVETYYNDDNLLCNKISIKELDKVGLKFLNEPIDSWLDIRTEFGYIRELNNTKYFYDKKNNLINVEIKYNQPQFPVYSMDSNLNNKIGTLDLETYGTNSGLGFHEVYAAGFAIKDKTELYYIERGETSGQFINRFFYNILMNNDLNGYTLYAHNLGRFDSVFIINSLIVNKDFTLTPVWKDNTILSLTIKYLSTEIILLDSLQLIPGSLENILESFKCKIKKIFFLIKQWIKIHYFILVKNQIKSFTVIYQIKNI